MSRADETNTPSDPLLAALHAQRRDIKRLAYTTLALFIAFAASFALALYLRSNDIEEFAQRNQALADSTNSALCAFKSDLEGRAANTQRFVDEIKQGERGLIPGITLADLERSIAAQRATIDSLAALDCVE